MKTKFDLHDRVWVAFRGEVFPAEVKHIHIADGGESYSVYNDTKGYFDLDSDRLFSTEQEAQASLYVFTKENFLKLVNELKGAYATLSGSGCYLPREAKLVSIRALLEDIKRK